MIRGIIYKYTSPSGKSYIGQTINEARRRKEWFNILVPYTQPSSKIDYARSKYGPDSFSYEVLYQGFYWNSSQAKQALNVLEVYFIGVFNTYNNGYNLTIGGDSIAGYRHSQESKEKMSIARKGRRISDTQKLKISIALKGRKHSQETKDKIGKAHKGAKRPAGTGQKISRALLGRILTEEQKRNISKGHIGIKYSQECIKKRIEKRKKAVLMLDLDGRILNEYPSIKEAAYSLNRKSCSSICQACKGQIPTAYGYIWKYKN